MSNPLVVVGAGSAGAVIAARVTEDASREVVLIEAGPDYPDELPADLRDGSRNSLIKHDWRFRFLPNRTHDPAAYPRGMVTGGSSSVNTCIALRGQPGDYDEWAERTGAHWRWDECLPCFRRLEDDRDFVDEWHGQGGPIPIRRHPEAELVPMQRAFLAACEARGYPSCPDHNRPGAVGFGPHAMNKIDGVRVSTASGYLAPARSRDNLRIEPSTLVRRVLFERRRVVGVELEHRGGAVIVQRSGRVVLCAGAIGTPAILMRSGIGPAAMLERIGVEVLVDAPVGERLFDHPGAAIVLAPRDGFADPLHPIVQTTLRLQPAGGFADEVQIQPISVIQLPMVPLLTAISAVLGKPSGHGRLWLESADPHARPRIETRLGEDPRDRARLRGALSLARAIAEAEPLASEVKVVWPSQEQLARSDTEWMLPGIGSGYHPCGTAPMGAEGDPLSVVDPFGRVCGVEGLVVADASIMPTIPTSNLNLPTIMIGERFGEWLRDGVL